MSIRPDPILRAESDRTEMVYPFAPPLEVLGSPANLLLVSASRTLRRDPHTGDA
jgi:hypothetical protein